MSKSPIKINDLLEEVSSQLKAVAINPNAHAYEPHEKQLRFHSSLAKTKLYIGGNRSGKTVGGVLEDYWWLTGTHPFRETPPPPVRGRLVCVDFPNGWEKIIKPTLLQWFPPSCFINGSFSESWNARYRILTLANGSTMDIMSYDQDLEAFAGASRHFIHCDEEPPSAIYKENKARLIDTGGSVWLTMTPVEGYTWVAEQIYEPFQQNGLSSGADVIEVDMTENPFLGRNEIDDFLSGLDDDEIKARKEGKFVQVGGLVYKDFNIERHVIKRVERIPNNWRVISSLDHGYNHPTAWLFHAVSPNGTIVTFAEHYRSEWTISQHVAAIREIEKEFGVRPDLYTGDPAIRQRSAINGNSILLEYSLKGIPVKPSNNDVKTGIARVTDYLRTGRWYITENCPNLIREMRKYKWKTRESRKLQEKHGSYDEPHKKDDDAVDSARYFFMSMPILTPEQVKEDWSSRRAEIQRLLNGKMGYNPAIGRFDNLKPIRSRSRFREVTDEYMGGEW